MFFLLLRLEINGNLKSARPTINLLIVLLWPECIDSHQKLPVLACNVF